MNYFLRALRTPALTSTMALGVALFALSPADWLFMALASDGLVAGALDLEAWPVDAWGLALGFTLLAWGADVVLAVVTMEAAEADRGTAIRARLSVGFTRVIRTRGISAMVTGAIAFLPAALVSRVVEEPSTRMVLYAAIATLAYAWMTFADRAALFSFDAAQDGVASRVRAEQRDIATHAPHYLDTSLPAHRFGAATGADEAVSAGGLALASSRGMLAVLAGLACDLARAALAFYFLTQPSIALFVLSNGTDGLTMAPVGLLVTAAVGAVLALVRAALFSSAAGARTS